MKYNIELIQHSIKKGEDQTYLFFWGHQPSKDGRITKSCLSQWWLSPFEEEDKTYHTAEHYMMAQKAKLFSDYEIMDLIVANKDPRQVKSLGRKVRNFDAKTWDENKYQIVKQGNYSKFSQNISLGNYLLSTEKKIIVEASPVDKIWGIGMAEDNPMIYMPSEWKGENLLGFALMEIRDQLTLKNDR